MFGGGWVTTTNLNLSMYKSQIPMTYKQIYSIFVKLKLNERVIRRKMSKEAPERGARTIRTRTPLVYNRQKKFLLTLPWLWTILGGTV